MSAGVLNMPVVVRVSVGPNTVHSIPKIGLSICANIPGLKIVYLYTV